jgi:hypothetical protein
VLSEKSRSSWFQNVGPIVGEDAVGEMLAHFPVTEGEKPVTKDHLDARTSELRGDMSQLRVEMSELRVELHQEITRLLFWVPTSVAAICAVIAFVARLTV